MITRSRGVIAQPDVQSPQDGRSSPIGAPELGTATIARNMRRLSKLCTCQASLTLPGTTRSRLATKGLSSRWTADPRRMGTPDRQDPNETIGVRLNPERATYPATRSRPQSDVEGGAARAHQDPMPSAGYSVWS
jgi:hypothetical protein